MSDKKNIAILLATYNGEKYLKQQLDSLLNQSFQPFRCYIHDDGSKDQTMDIINQYLSDYPDKFEYVPGKSCGGAKENFLFLLKSVEADVYMFCDQDDVWREDKIAVSLRALSAGNLGEPRCVYTDVVITNEQLEEISPSFFHFTHLDPCKNTYKQMLMDNVCIGCTLIFNRALREYLVKFKSNNIIMHDWEVALVAATVGELVFLNEATVFYRQHSDNTIGAAKELSIIKKIIRAATNIPDFFKRKDYFRDRPRMIARDLLQIQTLLEEKREFLSEFAKISQKNKRKRVQFYIDNDLFRQSINKLWQLVCV